MNPAIVLALQAVTGWTMPGLGHWPADTAASPISVSLAPATVSMKAEAPLDVTLAANVAGVRVSPFLQPTTGIALRVQTASGVDVAPAEPMMGSPPPPPLGVEELRAIPEDRPLVVHTRERTRTLFPGPGIYRVTATIALFDESSTPVRRLHAESLPVMVTVTP